MDVVLSWVRAGAVDLDGVDPRLVPLLRASLSPNPAERPHAYEVLDALERYAAGQAATVPTPSGSPWDPHGALPPADGSTQVFQDRGTAVLPAAQAPVTDPFIGYAHQMPLSSAAAPAAAPPPAQPPAPRGQPVRAWGPDPRHPARGAYAADDSDYDEAYEADDFDTYESGWEEDEPPREGDPRIGMAMRSGLLAGVAALWVGLLAAVPGWAIVALVAWSSLARAIDRSVTGLILRRYDHGRRRSDVPFAVVMSPWHFVLGVVATAVGLLLPVAVALAGVFATALLLAGWRGDGLGPGTPITLAVGGLLGLVMAWWGPGGASLRRGSRSIVRRVVPDGLASQAVGTLLVAGGMTALLVALGRGASLGWSPFGGNPFGG
jgi:hypothetical protein